MPGGEQDGEVAVDTALELTLGSTEGAVETYLQGPSPSTRARLLTALETLDQQIDSSDAYESSAIGSGALGSSTKGSVIGETSTVSAAEEITGAEFGAQMALVKAAKDEVRAPTAESLAELRAAQKALASVRGRGPHVS